MGVSNIITFDAHDPRVQNAIPLCGFDNFLSTYQFIKALFKHDTSLKIDKDSFMVISPDEGAMHRAEMCIRDSSQLLRRIHGRTILYLPAQ